MNYKAQDSNGAWWAYEKLPRPGQYIWIQYGGKIKYLDCTEKNDNWMNTLEKINDFRHRQ